MPDGSHYDDVDVGEIGRRADLRAVRLPGPLVRASGVVTATVLWL
jgi:hypothetical protein